MFLTKKELIINYSQLNGSDFKYWMKRNATHFSSYKRDKYLHNKCMQEKFNYLIIVIF